MGVKARDKENRGEQSNYIKISGTDTRSSTIRRSLLTDIRILHIASWEYSMSICL